VVRNESLRLFVKPDPVSDKFVKGLVDDYLHIMPVKDFNQLLKVIEKLISKSFSEKRDSHFIGFDVSPEYGPESANVRH
jgi:hypothetical protein